MSGHKAFPGLNTTPDVTGISILIANMIRTISGGDRKVQMIEVDSEINERIGIGNPGQIGCAHILGGFRIKGAIFSFVRPGFIHTLTLANRKISIKSQFLGKFSRQLDIASDILVWHFVLIVVGTKNGGRSEGTPGAGFGEGKISKEPEFIPDNRAA